TSRTMARFRQRMISFFDKPSAVRLATYSLVRWHTPCGQPLSGTALNSPARLRLGLVCVAWYARHSLAGLLLRLVALGLLRPGCVRDFHQIGRDTSELQSRFDIVCRLLLETKQ